MSQEVATRETAPQNVLAVFSNASFKQQVAAALPRHIGVESMMRIVLTEVRMNPDLQKCTVPSFMGALLKAAQSGLRPGMFGEGWILARWSGKLNSLEAQFQPGYMGLAQLAYRSGEVSDILAEAVYPSDHFKYQLGSDPKIEHVPDMDPDHQDEDIIAFYAVVKLVNGGTLMKVMRRADVDATRDKHGPHTKAGKLVGPWVSDYEAMGRKTVLIQALKLAPKESERLQMALQAEQDAIFGDRLAEGAVGNGKPVAERVAERIGVQVDGHTGEIIEGEADDDIGFTDEAPQANDPASLTETGQGGDDSADGTPYASEPETAPESPDDDDDGEVPGRGALFDASDPNRPASATDKKQLSEALAHVPTAATKSYRARFEGRSNSQLTHGEIEAFRAWAVAQVLT